MELPDVLTVQTSDYPKVVSAVMDSLDDLGKKVSSAVNNAQEAEISANNAKEQSAGFGHKKTAIESLQVTVESLAAAGISQAEAQKMAFEYQTQQAKLSRYLFELGCVSIGAHRSIVRELELRLTGASAEDLSDLTKQETLLVLQQLKEHEHILTTQQQQADDLDTIMNDNARQDQEIDKLKKITHDHIGVLKKQTEIGKKHDEALRIQEEADERHNEAFNIQAETNKLYEEALHNLIETTQSLEEALPSLNEANIRYDEALALQTVTNKQYEKELHELENTGKNHDAALLNQTNEIQKHDEAISSLRDNSENEQQLMKTRLVIAFVVGGSGLVIGLVSLLLQFI